MIAFTDLQKIGIGLSGFGLFFLTLGMLLLFDKGLLAIGNILFISGISLIIGLERTVKFFFGPQKLKGSVFFFGGVFIVLIGWPLIGILIELYGFIYLFGGFLPVVVSFLRRIPFIGTLFSLPGIKQLMDKIGDGNSMV
ncbi:vesicle transport GOT1B-like [Brachionus plicatilis]|uniref:Vesicle transport GOT1B-like n=1 Tax=Brachionus plicatilis TaxID=10195 RepID=A0A3M7PUC4_BRAPC|nr:vesicle transport GOT1B-like [Brachionus plicatilis]